MTTSENITILRKSQIKEIQTNAQNIKDEIRNIRQRVVEVILRKEKQLLDKVDRSSDEQLHELHAEIKSQEIELQMYQQQYEFTANAVTSNCERDMYAVYESVGQAPTDNRQTGNRPAPGRVVFTHDMGNRPAPGRVVFTHDTDNRPAQGRVVFTHDTGNRPAPGRVVFTHDTDNRPAQGRVVFTHDMDKLSKAVDDLQLGEVAAVRCVSDRQSTPVLHHNIDCVADGDKKDTHLNDVTVLTVDGLTVTVVADYYNKSLKTYHTSDPNTLGNLLLSGWPWQIAKLSESQIAVSVPNNKEIVTVNVTPDPVLLSTIKTSKEYFALSSLSPSQLAAGTCRQSHSVDILDMTGRILKSINTGIIRSPDYIHVTSNGDLKVSGVNSLVCVTSEGVAVSTYTPAGVRALTFPRGITTTSTGDILLADKDSHKVIQLTESGQFVRDVLTHQDGLKDPRGICLDGDRFLYVTCGRFVRIFKFKKTL
ncbi:uncharacterized protein LOC125383712 isoform X2 [Haliotis rufescens]|uniref:uncharacterized protein LOC125383712 isoform X2 n=1 Tax=Haliotis rufescens TaxID=6454 RepID=UPI00201F6814|nr:uncharacterized protein LOC125383712 isoform X2 [Haliotis rufescens]